MLLIYGVVGLLLSQEAFSEPNNGWIRLPHYLQQKNRRTNGIQSSRGQPNYNLQPQTNGIQSSRGQPNYNLQPQTSGIQSSIQSSRGQPNYNLQPQTNGIQSSIQSSRGQSNYNLQPQTNGIQSSIQNSRGQSNYNLQPQTNGIQSSRGQSNYNLQAQTNGIQSSRGEANYNLHPLNFPPEPMGNFRPGVLPPGNYPLSNIPPVMMDYGDYNVPDDYHQPNLPFNDYGPPVPDNFPPPQPPPYRDYGPPVAANNFPPPPYNDPSSLIPGDMMYPVNPFISEPKPMKPIVLPSTPEKRRIPCGSAPFPPITQENKLCRYMGSNFERFFYDASVGGCRKYSSCQGPTLDMKLNTLRNSFDSFEECSLSCYMMGTCCRRRNSISDVPSAPSPKEVTQSNRFTCRDGTFIPKEGRCNGIHQCTDGEDELNCPSAINSSSNFTNTQYFRCKNGIYIEKSFLCDGIYHCANREDELNCPLKTNVPRVQSLTFENFDNMVFKRTRTPFVVVYFFAPWCKACTRFRPTFKRVAKEYYTTRRNITFYDVNLVEEPLLGERFMVDTFPRILLWNMMLQGTPMEFYKDYGLDINGFTYWLEAAFKNTQTNNCGLLEFPCLSEFKCIPKNFVCDSLWQCRDGSDERLCQQSREAAEDQGGVIKASQTIDSSPDTVTWIRTTRQPRITTRRTTPKNTTTRKIAQRPTRKRTSTTQRTTPRRKVWTTTRKKTTTRTLPKKTTPLTTTRPTTTATTTPPTTTTKKIVRVTPYIPWTTSKPQTTTSTTTSTTTGSDIYEYYDHEKEIFDYGILGSVLPIEAGDSKKKKPSCELRCRDGTCIRFSNRCNGVRECSDGEDEEDCASCKRTQFTCKSNKECIDYMRRCDGEMDCEDGSDEELCELECKKTEFICNDGTCINFAKRCNGVYNCADKSDETFCPNPCNATTEFTCNDGKCIDKGFLCDGSPHCHDSTDEISCSKSDNCENENEWKCLTGDVCIDKRKRCDGYPDCHDLSDEDIDQCPKMECNDEWQFQCWDRKRCIDSRRLCDGYEDCLDRSDEIDCMSVVCQYWQYKCLDDGVCVDSRRKCDGYNDCKDGSDELNCEGLSTQIYVFEHSPMTLKAILLSDAILDCNVVNPSGKWTYEGQNVHQSTNAGREGRLGSSFSNGSLLIKNVQKEDVGYYTCASTEGNEVSSVYLILDNSSCTKECKEEDNPTPVCGSNGVKYSSLCELKKTSCNLKVKISVVDMSKCLRLSNSKCAVDELECGDGKCIKETSFCDGTIDCEDERDEKLCRKRDMKSVIMGKNVSVAIQTELEPKVIKIKCYLASGSDLWLFNDKIIQSDSAHEVNQDENELVITDVRKGDAGWYSCRNMDMEEFTTYLDVEYPASTLGGPAELSFLVGQRGVIPCRNDANPPISYIVWHKNGSPIGSTTGSLVLTDVISSKDRGDYTCTPYNSRGTMGPSTKVAIRVRTRFYECPLYCSSSVYDPVCGIDGVTYENECFLIMESCNNIRLKDLYAVHSGSCEKKTLAFAGIGSMQSTTSNILEILGASTTMVPYIDLYEMETTVSPPLNVYAFPTTTICPSTPTPFTTTPIYLSWTTTRVPYESTDLPTKSCRSQEWSCDDGHCIPFVNQCNGIPDCPNGEDEKYCADFKNDFVCGDMLIDKSLVCDGYPHCLNGEDENDCPIQEEEEKFTWTCPNPDDEHICDDYGKCVCASLAPGASLPPPLVGFTPTPFPFLGTDISKYEDFFGSGDYQMDDA